ncbi:MAG: MT-A70 family methyltransferase [Nanoarchaeota archaeon]
MNTIIKEDWYEALVEECKAIITETIFISRWALVEGYWKLGERISEENENFKRDKIYGEKIVQGLANSLGISTRTIHYAVQAYNKFPKLGNIPEGKNISWNKLITQYLPEPKKIEIIEKLPKNKFQVIYIDPPWDVKAGPDWGSGEQSKDLIYPTMSLEEISSMPINELADKNAHLYLWTINKYIRESYDIVRRWGFEPSCLLTWIKPPHGIGLGGTFIQTTEHLLFCRRGTLEAKKRIDTTWFQYPRGKHSEKPEEFRKMIEEVSPGNRIVLFARTKTKGWEVWGNEI